MLFEWIICLFLNSEYKQRSNISYACITLCKIYEFENFEKIEISDFSVVVLYIFFIA